MVPYFEVSAPIPDYIYDYTYKLINKIFYLYKYRKVSININVMFIFIDTYVYMCL